ncbi:hypothetical protein BC629DRAFT_1521809 [Irpex lacteus]|nr:hypothetical protein BC629DRAFT_1521809 [Irpex lacteus]
MPKAKVTRVDRVSQQEGLEARLGQACRYLRKHKDTVMTAVATKFDVPYYTLRRRYLDLSCPAPDAPKKNRFLSRVQEKVLVKWLRLWAAQGTPVSRNGLCEIIALGYEARTVLQPNSYWKAFRGVLGDEMGGGRKSTGLKYFYSRHDRARYKKRSADLELVTIIECVSADGTALDPGFIFSGKNFDMEWFSALRGRRHAWYVSYYFVV